MSPLSLCTTASRSSLGSLLLLCACSSAPDDDGFQSETSPPSITPTPTPWPVGVVTPTPMPDPNAGRYPLARADVQLTGSASGDMAGFNALVAGDLNGDGYADLAIAAPGSDLRQPDAGAVFLVFGSAKGIESLELTQAKAWLEGEGRGDRAGQGLAALGDVNGDGLDDLAIGAPYQDAGGIDAGKIYLVFGRASGWYPGMRLSDASAGFVGKQGEALGGLDTLAGGGDFNGDGYQDLLIGNPYAADAGAEAGKLTLIAGHPGSWTASASVSTAGLSWTGQSVGTWLGASSSFVHDLDGDGYDEVLVGAPRSSPNGVSSGAAWLIPGEGSVPKEVRSISTAPLQLTGETAGEEAGGFVSSGTDLSGDGLDELLIAASGNSTAGSAGKLYVVQGSEARTSPQEPLPLRRAELTIHGSRTSEYLGRPSLGVGDMDGDGLGELLLGVWNVDPQYSQPSTDAALLFSWPDTLSDRSLFDLDAPWIFDHEQPPDAAGYSLGGAGDVDGDGFPEMLIGAPLLDTVGAVDGGRVYLYFGGAPFLPQSW